VLGIGVGGAGVGVLGIKVLVGGTEVWVAVGFLAVETTVTVSGRRVTGAELIEESWLWQLVTATINKNRITKSLLMTFSPIGAHFCDA